LAAWRSSLKLRRLAFTVNKIRGSLEKNNCP